MSPKSGFLFVLFLLTILSEVQYEVHIQYQSDVKAKLDIAHFQHNWFSGWSIPNIYGLSSAYNKDLF